jgi:hypothetical protein
MKTLGFFFGNTRSVFHCITLVLAVLGFGGGAAFSERATPLNWEMLIPPTDPLANFLEDVPLEQQEALRDFDYLQGYLAHESVEQLADQIDEAKRRVDANREKFAKQGVDIDALYERYLDWVGEVERRGTLTEKKLDGKQVAIAGYLLPLDFNPGGTTEFLLVPYFGACIHEPPPPPNQIVYVKSSAPFAVTSLFEGVMITGTMRVQSEKKHLSFVDGSSEVASGYVLEGDSIEPYQNEQGGQ